MHAEEDRQQRRRILETARRVVVLGASPDPRKPSCYVGQFLSDAGYEVTGVSPRHAGGTIYGAPVYATVQEAAAALGPLDLVDVFRRPEDLPGHLDDLVAASPAAVWLQSGIRHAEVAAALRAAGIAVVEDRCTMVDYRTLGVVRQRSD